MVTVNCEYAMPPVNISMKSSADRYFGRAWCLVKVFILFEVNAKNYITLYVYLTTRFPAQVDKFASISMLPRLDLHG